MTRPNRQNIYLPDHLRDYLSEYPSLSGRIATIVDRYAEALRRTRIERRFSAQEQAAILDACSGWRAEPAATVFGGIALELDDAGAPQALVEKVRAMSPLEEVALVEWIETRRRG